MTILIISDLHFEKGYHNETYQGDSLKWLNDIIDIHKPTALVGLGDWGYGWTYDDWESLTKKLTVNAIYGNHDYLDMLRWARNSESHVLAIDGEVRNIEGIRFGFINGIISNRVNLNPLFVPRRKAEDFFQAATHLNGIDVLCTHETPRLEDLEKRMHLNPGTIVVESLINRLRPALSLSGHIHLKEGWHSSKIGTSLSVLIDSSATSKRYALIEDKSISIWHEGKALYSHLTIL